MPCRGRVLESPCGPLVLLVDERQSVTGLHFARDRPPAPDCPDWDGMPVVWDDAATAAAAAQIDEYFAGARRRFELALAPVGPPFRQRVWAALREIPWGDTISYGELARRIGNPGAARAVGRANGANPIAIIVPCHRVIGADGSLVGFGGGLDNKEILLQHEGLPIRRQGRLAL